MTVSTEMGKPNAMVESEKLEWSHQAAARGPQRSRLQAVHNRYSQYL
jgi:hypothetical protein